MKNKKKEGWVNENSTLISRETVITLAEPLDEEWEKKRPLKKIEIKEFNMERRIRLLSLKEKVNEVYNYLDNLEKREVKKGGEGE